MPCDMCADDNVVADFFCLECDSSLCASCMHRVHHVGTKFELHSIERIRKTHGVKIFTPIMTEILCVVIVATVLNNFHITSFYMYEMDICPIQRHAMFIFTLYDQGLVQLLKTPLHWYCSIEDSFWRLFFRLVGPHHRDRE